MPRFEDALAYASLTLLGLGVALGAGGFWQAEIVLHDGAARQLYLIGAAAALAAVASMLVSVAIAEFRARYPKAPRRARLRLAYVGPGRSSDTRLASPGLRDGQRCAA